jgi:uncharacterized protein with PIN domain
MCKVHLRSQTVHSNDTHRCEECGSIGEDVDLTEDPYKSDVHGDHTKYWMCKSCVEESIMEI